MQPALTWIDLTARDRDQMRRVLDLFSEQGTVDEMGLETLSHSSDRITRRRWRAMAPGEWRFLMSALVGITFWKQPVLYSYGAITPRGYID